MIQDHEITAWLGGTDATDEQRTAIRDAWETIAGLIDPDLWQQEASTAAAAYILGDTTIRERGDALMAARARAEEAAAELRGVVIAAVQAGQSEASLAAETGLSRTTVRDWIGK